MSTSNVQIDVILVCHCTTRFSAWTKNQFFYYSLNIKLGKMNLIWKQSCIFLIIKSLTWIILLKNKSIGNGWTFTQYMSFRLHNTKQQQLNSRAWSICHMILCKIAPCRLLEVLFSLSGVKQLLVKTHIRKITNQ